MMRVITPKLDVGGQFGYEGDRSWSESTNRGGIADLSGV